MAKNGTSKKKIVKNKKTAKTVSKKTKVKKSTNKKVATKKKNTKPSKFNSVTTLRGTRKVSNKKSSKKYTLTIIIKKIINFN
jgi:hypothetical protein